MKKHRALKIKFNEETEITGYMKLHLFLECRGHYNMDLFPLGQEVQR